MKKLLYTLPLLGWAHLAAAQHTELIGRAGLNGSWFAGNGSETESFINGYGTSYAGGYTNNPYGGRLGLGAGLGGRLLHESRFPLLLALDLGYDYQRARTSILGVGYYDGQQYRNYAATGSSYLASQHIQLFLAAGYRFRLGGYRLDVLAGPELAAVFGKRETGDGTYDGSQTWRTSLARGSGIPFDGLLRADLTVWRGHWGLNGSYAAGGLDYRAGLIGGTSRPAFDRSLRVGVTYRLRGGE